MSDMDDLTVSQATLEYVCDIPPEEMWNQRGLRGHRMSQAEKESWHEEKQRRIKRGIEEEETRARLEQFVAGVDKIDQSLARDPRDCVRELFPGAEWLFVVGMARTGGTYLLSEYFRMLGETIEDYGFRMIHDGIPLYENLAFHHLDEKRRKLRYELAQWLLWCYHELSHLDVIPKKRISFAHALPVLDEYFGSSATYVFTLRHPGEIALSWSEMESLNREGMDETQASWWAYMKDRTGVDQETWETVGFRERLLRLWEQYHRDVSTAMPLEGDVRVLRFGEEYEQFMDSEAADRDRSHSPDTFSSRDRSLHEWWTSDEVRSRIRAVGSEWEEAGLRFPEFT
jgi:hypothetical protein